MCSLGERPSVERAAAKAAACAANSCTVDTGTTSQPSAMRAARAIPAGTCEPTRIRPSGRSASPLAWAPIRIGGRDCSGRGRMEAFENCQWRPWCVTLSSLHSRRMISTPSVSRLTRSTIGTLKTANSSVR